MKITMNSETTTISQGYERFIKHCEVKGYSQSTLDNYTYMFSRFSKRIDLNNDISTINNNTIELYATMAKPKLRKKKSGNAKAFKPKRTAMNGIIMDGQG